jgi:hypothetical protein
VDSATIACTVIIILAQRASGMVSVGENAITFVTLTHGKCSAQASACRPGTSASGFVGDACYCHGYN